MNKFKKYVRWFHRSIGVVVVFVCFVGMVIVLPGYCVLFWIINGVRVKRKLRTYDTNPTRTIPLSVNYGGVVYEADLYVGYADIDTLLGMYTPKWLLTGFCQDVPRQGRDSKYSIFIPPAVLVARTEVYRFIIEHELGHIVLGHLGTPHNLEDELAADIFAAEHLSYEVVCRALEKMLLNTVISFYLKDTVELFKRLQRLRKLQMRQELEA